MVVVVSMLLLPVITVVQAATNTRFFAAPNNALGTTNFYCIVPAVGDRIAVVRTVEVLTDLGNARVTFYTNGASVDIPYGMVAGLTNVQVAQSGTNGLVTGDKVVIQTGNTPNDAYVLASVHLIGTNLTFLTSNTVSIAAGSRLWRIGTNTWAYGITNGATSPRNSFVAVGEKGRPLVVTVGATSAGSINVGGTFESEAP